MRIQYIPLVGMFFNLSIIFKTTIPRMKSSSPMLADFTNEKSGACIPPCA